MGKRPKKKIVLFLVEGKSEREALQIAVSELYEKIDENIELFFPTIRDDNNKIGGDITSKLGVHPRNIEEKIYKLFLYDFFDEEKIYPKDITEIIQIVDTDGAYVPNTAVHEGINPNGNDKTYYRSDGIICSNPDNILKRNEYKRENLDYLSSLTSIKILQKTIPYSVYYFSSNLDHFLHNDANLDNQLKCSLADEFAKNYIGNPFRFVNDISNDPASITGLNYIESWDYIKEGLNSLQRHTNINLLLNKLALE